MNQKFWAKQAKLITDTSAILDLSGVLGGEEGDGDEDEFQKKPGLSTEESRFCGNPKYPLSAFSQEMLTELELVLSAKNAETLRTELSRLADKLFSRSAELAASGENFADFWLYQTRLLFRCRIKKAKSLMVKRRERALLDLLERHSRGLADIYFEDGSKRPVLLLAYDPWLGFGAELDEEEQPEALGNISGRMALRFHGQNLLNHLGRAEMSFRAVILPIRYADFDTGIVEKFLSPLIRDNKLEAIISMSTDFTSFEHLSIDRFAANIRSGDEDNDNQRAREGSIIPSAPAFYETRLRYENYPNNPLPSIAGGLILQLAEGYDGKTFNRLDLRAKIPSSEVFGLSTAIEGSGGRYLSNELFYRIAHLRAKEATDMVDIVNGHLHLPMTLMRNSRGNEAVFNLLQNLFRYVV